MCERSTIDDGGRNPPMFPLKKAPQTTDKFPFRDVKHYINPVDEEVKAKWRTRIGYVAQMSINHFESTGRKPALEHVPWWRTIGTTARR